MTLAHLDESDRFRLIVGALIDAGRPDIAERCYMDDEGVARTSLTDYADRLFFARAVRSLRLVDDADRYCAHCWAIGNYWCEHGAYA